MRRPFTEEDERVIRACVMRSKKYDELFDCIDSELPEQARVYRLASDDEFLRIRCNSLRALRETRKVMCGIHGWNEYGNEIYTDTINGMPIQSVIMTLYYDLKRIV